jgi:hypothetical protein
MVYRGIFLFFGKGKKLHLNKYSYRVNIKRRKKLGKWQCVILVQYHFGPKLTLMYNIGYNGKITNTIKNFTKFWTKITCLQLLDQKYIGLK